MFKTLVACSLLCTIAFLQPTYSFAENAAPGSGIDKIMSEISDSTSNSETTVDLRPYQLRRIKEFGCDPCIMLTVPKKWRLEAKRKLFAGELPDTSTHTGNVFGQKAAVIFVGMPSCFDEENPGPDCLNKQGPWTDMNEVDHFCPSPTIGPDKCRSTNPDPNAAASEETEICESGDADFSKVPTPDMEKIAPRKLICDQEEKQLRAKKSVLRFNTPVSATPNSPSSDEGEN